MKKIDMRFAIVHGGYPPVNYYNDEVRHNKFYPFLDELVKCGVKGFRFDMGKHFSLPEEGCEFYNEVKDRYPDIFIYSECIFNYWSYDL